MRGFYRCIWRKGPWESTNWFCFNWIYLGSWLWSSFCLLYSIISSCSSSSFWTWFYRWRESLTWWTCWQKSFPNFLNLPDFLQKRFTVPINKQYQEFYYSFIYNIRINLKFSNTKFRYLYLINKLFRGDLCVQEFINLLQSLLAVLPGKVKD